MPRVIGGASFEIRMLSRNIYLSRYYSITLRNEQLLISLMSPYRNKDRNTLFEKNYRIIRYSKIESKLHEHRHKLCYRLIQSIKNPPIIIRSSLHLFLF